MVGEPLSCVHSTEVGIVNADGTADEADTDGDVVDLDMIDAMVKREAGICKVEKGQWERIPS